MTIKLTQAEATTMGFMRQGAKNSPPLRRQSLDSLERKGYVEQRIVFGSVQWFLTEAGKNFGSSK